MTMTDTTREFLYTPNTFKDEQSLRGGILEAQSHIPGLVFNYPPIAVWNKERTSIPEPQQLWKNSSVFPHNLYIHIPFCRQKCSFCYYSVAVHQQEDEVWSYLRCLELEAQRYADMFKTTPFETVFIGGGTPSRLNPEQIQFLFDKVIRRFDLSKCREITFECAPDSITEEKVAAMLEAQVTRVSMGVQSFDEAILDKTGRASDSTSLLDHYNIAARAGFRQVNIDLIAGVEREQEENMEHTMNTLANLEHKPTQVTMFTLSLREGAIAFKRFKSDSTVEVYKESLRRYLYARDRLKRLGYWQYSKNLFPTLDNIFHYQDNLWGRNGYVLALGASGYGHSHNYTYQNHFNYKHYMKSILAGETAIEKVFHLSEDESLRRHLVLAMKHVDVDKQQFASFYTQGIAVLKPFEPIFDALEKEGLITQSKERIQYTDEGIHSVDRYVRLFYSQDVNSAVRALHEGERRGLNDAFNFTV